MKRFLFTASQIVVASFLFWGSLTFAHAADDVLFNSVTAGTADSGNVQEEYPLSNEGDYSAIQHILSDDYNRITQIMRTSGDQNSPFIIGLFSRGTLDAPTTAQIGDRGLSFAAGVRSADDTWERLGYMWWEVKDTPVGTSTPGMWVLRLTKPGQYFPDPNTLRIDWTDGARFGMHSGFNGVIHQTDAATINWNVVEAQVAEVTLGGNRTLSPSGMKDGFEYDFYVTADGAARTLNFDNALEWSLKGSDGRSYSEAQPIRLPAGGFAHIKMSYGGGAIVGAVTFISGHTQRAVVPSEQITSLTANRIGSNSNSAQAVFSSAEDALTVVANTAYFFEAVYSFNRSSGTTAHRTNVLFGGTATFTSIGYHVIPSSTEADLGGGLPYALGKHASVATAFDVFGVNTNDANEMVTIKLSGVMRINAGGTVIPQIQYSAAPGGAPTFLAGSYFKAYPIGSNTVASVGDFN